jgi:2-methylcitrate dehydratase PrpD
MTDVQPQSPQTDATALFVANFHDVRFEQLPPAVVSITKDQVLDFFGVALGGSREAGAAEVRDLALEWGGAPQTNAAQVNATMAHCLDFDDVHEDAIMHPGVVAIPTALAMAEYVAGTGGRPVSGKDFIAAIVVGTDFICRLGLATRPGESIHQYGWHLTTLFGYMTAAGIAARMLGLDEAGITNAIGIGYHQSSGNGQCVKAKRGVTGARNCLEGAAGMYAVYHGHSYSREKLVGDLGMRFESINVSIKPYPCCRGVHPSLDAALALVNEHDVRPEDVRSIVIYCGEATYGLLGSPLEIKARPRNFVDAQFSLAWGVATAIARRRATLDDFSPEAITSPDILAMSALIDVRNDPALDRGDQGIEPARVEITMKDGRVLVHQVDFPTGTPERPLAFADVERKFRELLAHAGQPIAAEKADRLVRTVAALETVEDVRELIGLAT